MGISSSGIMSEGRMLIQEFSERAAECITYAQRAKSDHDRQFFIEMARAWCGVTEQKPEEQAAEPISKGTH
jgi:hypothetical protein